MVAKPSNLRLMHLTGTRVQRHLRVQFAILNAVVLVCTMAHGVFAQATSERTSPESVSALMREGSAALKSKDFESARESFQEIVVMNPRHSSAWISLGLAYYGLKQMD